MTFSLLRLYGVLFASIGLFLALVLGSRQSHAQGASAHPHARAQAPIPTPLRHPFCSCRIWRYQGADSTQKLLRFHQRFNAHGRLVEDTHYSGAGSHLYVFTAERSYYRGGHLTKQIQWQMPGKRRKGKLRTRFHYNRQGQLVREESVSFRHPIKRGLKRGRGSGGTDLIGLNDLARHRRPEQRTRVRYTYSPQGHLAEEVEAYGMPDPTDHSRHTWAYDSLGRPARHAIFDGETLRAVAHYRYWTVAGGSRCDQTWSDTEAPVRPGEAASPAETPPHTVSTYFDAQQRPVKQVSLREPGQAAEVVLTTYDAEGRPHQQQTLDATGEPGDTWLYTYP
ncbi:hypothetical protein [uncultured Hymenobacter sp.]|uniref:hypothetical protein n=1 Tax=uncultured Hymenobacter sp. TaxID=170016 RepID=UPI0035CBFE99